MRTGYVRVSTQDQSVARQMEALKPYNIEKFYVEKISGKNTARPEFQRMMDFLREGDELYVSEWSRLSRSTMDLLNTISTLNDRGVKIVSLKENFDTSTPQGKLILTVFAGLNEFERALILERQRDGIALAKAEGRYKGRAEKKLENFDEVYGLWADKRISATAAADALGITRATFYNRVKKYVIDY
ncbi:MAG: recombinase family protein [Butyrivibrio sp.]|nr:recombinase family protein [Butyrivibrio sp.]